MNIINQGKSFVFNVSFINQFTLTRSATFARSIIVLMSLLHSMKVRRRFLPERKSIIEKYIEKRFKRKETSDNNQNRGIP